VSRLRFVLEHVHAAVPVADVHQAIRRHVDVARLRGKPDVGPGIDEFRRNRRYPGGDFLRRECVPDVGKHDWFGIRLDVSGDGSTLAVGAPNEDSAAQGIKGRQDDNSADEAGAL
jgi:hypothetical protein